MKVPLEITPPTATHRTQRTLAAHLGISTPLVTRVWKGHNLKPHRVKSLKLRRDPQFIEKLVDVVGLYLRPPEHALVLNADERSQIQALDRTQPSLPLKPSRRGTRTHGYERHGTTTLFAALEVATGKLIGQCLPRHRHQEWLKFLKLIDARTPADLDLHMIADNYCTHKHPTVKAWLARQPRFHMHFVPKSGSWVNLVERWRRELTVKRVRRGSFRSVAALLQAIDSYVAGHNQAPRPLARTADLADILPKILRAHAALDTIEN